MMARAGCRVVFDRKQSITVKGAVPNNQGDPSVQTYNFVDVLTTVLDPTTKEARCILKLNWCLDDTNNKFESTLINRHSVEANGYKIYETAAIFEEKPRVNQQCIVSKQHKLRLYMLFSGEDMFLATRSTTDSDIASLPFFELNSDQRYDPDHLVNQYKYNLKLGSMARKRQRQPKEDPLEVAKVNHLVNSATNAGNLMPSKVLSDPKDRLKWDRARLHEWGLRLLASPGKVKRTFENTTQFYKGLAVENSRDPPQWHQPRFVTGRRLNETVWTDTVFLKLSRWDKSPTSNHAFQFFVCRTSGFAKAYYLGKAKDKAAPKLENPRKTALEDFCRHYGIPKCLSADYDQQLVRSSGWLEIMRHHTITDHTSEPHMHDQIYSDKAWQLIQRNAGYALTYSQTFDQIERLIDHVTHLYNVTSKYALGNRTPYEVFYGETPDISNIRFRWGQRVWFREVAKKPMKPGIFLGLAHRVGDFATYWVKPEHRDPNDRTPTVLARSIVLPRNLGEQAPRDTYNLPSSYWFPTYKPGVKPGSKRKRSDADPPPSDSTRGEKDVTIEPEEDEKEQPEHSKVTPGSVPVPLGADLAHNNLIWDSDDDGLEGIVLKRPRIETLTTGNRVGDGARGGWDPQISDEDLDLLSSDSDTDLVESITGILGMRKRGDELIVTVTTAEGSNIETTFDEVRSDCPNMTASYLLAYMAKRKNAKLSGVWEPAIEWAKRFSQAKVNAIKRLSRIAGHDTPAIRRLARGFPGGRKKRTAKHFKGKQRFQIQVKYGVIVPRDVAHALQLDELNGDRLWREAIQCEMTALLEMQTFAKSHTQSKDDLKGEGYQFTSLRMIFDVKSNLRRKARLVIGGHRIDASSHWSNASVMEARSVKLLLLLAERHGLEVVSADIKNAYLNAETKEKVCCIAGPEFQLHGFCKTGTIITVVKALYGLASSAARWRAHLADTLRGLGFERSVADPDTWMRDEGEAGYTYIGSHVDDLLIVGQKEIVSKLMAELRSVYVIKTVSNPPESHLGVDYQKVNRNGVERFELHCETYLKEMLRRLESSAAAWLGQSSTGPVMGKANLPMRVGLQPELFQDATSDDHVLLNPMDHRLYQQIVGGLNWAVIIGRLDITYALSSLSRFASAPRKGHMRSIIRILQYLNSNLAWRIRIDPTEFKVEGDITDVRWKENDWRDDYAGSSESSYINDSLPLPKWDAFSVKVFCDSDMAHDVKTRRSVSGMIILVGSTPVVYHARRQGSIATSTYTAELMACKGAVEKTIDLRLLMRSLGIKVVDACDLYIDNLGVFQSVGEGETSKARHTSVAFHLVRESVAAGIVIPHHIPGEFNPADLFTKALSRPTFAKHRDRLMVRKN